MVYEIRPTHLAVILKEICQQELFSGKDSEVPPATLFGTAFEIPERRSLHFMIEGNLENTLKKKGILPLPKSWRKWEIHLLATSKQAALVETDGRTVAMFTTSLPDGLMIGKTYNLGELGDNAVEQVRKQLALTPPEDSASGDGVSLTERELRILALITGNRVPGATDMSTLSLADQASRYEEEVALIDSFLPDLSRLTAKLPRLRNALFHRSKTMAAAADLAEAAPVIVPSESS